MSLKPYPLTEERCLELMELYNEQSRQAGDPVLSQRYRRLANHYGRVPKIVHITQVLGRPAKVKVLYAKSKPGN